MVDSPIEGRRPGQNLSAQLASEGGPSLHEVISPLWLIFAGALICTIRLSVTVRLPGDWTLQPSAAPIGAVMVVRGVWRLFKIGTDRDFRRRMLYVLAVAILKVPATIAEFFPWLNDPGYAVIRIVLSLAVCFASIEFCRGMRSWCQTLGFRRSEKAWRKTALLFGFCCVPFALFDLLLLVQMVDIAGVYSSMTTRPVIWIRSWWLLLLGPFMIAPPVAFVRCIVQTRRNLSHEDKIKRAEFVPLKAFNKPVPIETVPAQPVPVEAARNGGN